MAEILFTEKSPHKMEDIIPGDDTSIDTDGIFTEVINTKLAADVIGFSTHVKLKEKQTRDSRLSGNGFNYDITFYSGKWDERFRITAYNPIGFKLQAKSRWYTGWSTRTFCSIYYPNPCNTYWNLLGTEELDIDGPYKHRVIIDYDNYADFTWDFYDL